MDAVELVTVDPAGPEGRWAREQYFAELQARLPGGFDPELGGGDHDAPTMRPPGGAFVVARHEGAVIGCGALRSLDDQTAEIKRMWVSADWRGLGVGRRLLEHLEGEARALGRRRVVLDTSATLVEAISMYERAGYWAVEPYNDNPYAERWFARDL